MFTRIHFFIVAALLLIPATIQAQKIWTLQECVDYAARNNLQVKQAIIRTEQSDMNQTQNLLSMFPSLNASGSYSNNFGRSVDPFSYQFTDRNVKSANFSVSSNVTLFNGFQLQNELKKSKLDYMADKYDLEKLVNDISLNVAAAYLQVIYSKEQLQSAKDRVTASMQQRDRTKLMVDAGLLAQGSLLEAEAQLSNEELARVNAENSLNISLLTLSQLLELESAGSIEVESPKVDIPDQSALAMSPEEIFSSSVKSKPEIKSAEFRMQSADKSLSIARGAMFPRISAFGSINTGYSNQTSRLKSLGGDYLGDVITPYYVATPAGNYPVFTPTYSGAAFEDSPFSSQVEDNLNKSVGVNINIPIFNGWSTQTNIKRAKLNSENAKYSAQITKNQLLKSVQQAHADAIAAMNRHTAAQKNVKSMEESFRYTEKKYEAGLLNSLDFITIQNNFSKAQSDLLQAKYDFIFRLKVLDFYLGKPLVY